MHYYESLAAEYAKEHLGTRIKDINIASLERTDTYRGKYPHMGPRPDGDQEGTVTDGEDYPLTDKLDYVFLKRPMRPEGKT